MESRKPFQLNSIMTFYNFVQVVLNTYFGLKAFYLLLWKHDFNYSCESLDFSTSEFAINVVDLNYAYFMLKICDLFDTLFIVLKKKENQLSFLHCYHHGGMVLATYMSSKWLPGGPPIMLGVVNTLVHMVMYSYYFLTAFKPELKKSLWWKKHITQIQLAQFMFLFVHFLRATLTKDCEYPQFFLIALLVQDIFFLALFSDFYRKVYMKKKSS